MHVRTRAIVGLSSLALLIAFGFNNCGGAVPDGEHGANSKDQSSIGPEPFHLVNQTVSRVADSGISFAIPATGAGRLLIVAVDVGAPQAASVISISDSGAGSSSVYTEVPNARTTYTGGGTSFWYVNNTRAGINSLNISITSGKYTAHVYELAGADKDNPIDSVAKLCGAAANPAVGPKLTTLSGVNFIVAAMVNEGSVMSVASPLTLIKDNYGNGSAYYMADSGSPVVVTPTFTLDAAQPFCISAVAFKALP